MGDWEQEGRRAREGTEVRPTYLGAISMWLILMPAPVMLITVKASVTRTTTAVELQPM